jgi:hypothetical protein
MQGTGNYTPETSHVSRAYSSAAILYLQFMLHVMFLPMLNVVVVLLLLCTLHQALLRLVLIQLQASPKQFEILLRLYVKTSGQYGMFHEVLSFEYHSTCSNAYFHV